MKEKWWKRSVVYQIYPRSFCDGNGDGIGDINGIRSKLWYLKKLGIDVIWLSPVYGSPNADNGYDISDYYGISPEYGTMDEMKALIRECENCGIRIMMDLVVNHTSDEHPWFMEAKKSKNNPYRNYYIWRKGEAGSPPNGLESCFGGSAWEYSEETGEYYLHFYHKKQPDLNWENEAMRKEIWKMMNFWIDMGIGGFRMDVIDVIGKIPDQGIKENGPKLHEYLQEMNRETFGDKNLMTVGECWGADIENGSLYSDPERKELDMIFQFEQMLTDQVPGKQKWDLKLLELKQLKQAFAKWQKALEGKGWNSLFWNSHDLPRIVSRWGNDKEYRVESAKMLATVLHGMKGTPYIYQGEEIGMTNYPFSGIEDFMDVESVNMYQERKQIGYSEEEIMESLCAKSRDNARTPMQWNSGPQAGFTKGTPWCRVNPNYTEINAEEALKDSDSIFYYYQKLISLRKEEPILIYGTFELLCPEDEQVFAYMREWMGKKWLVVCNFYGKPAEFDYPGRGRVILSNYRQDSVTQLEQMKLRPYEAAIYEMIESGNHIIQRRD
ncbi:alpha-glucosidase [Petralouisia muris]|uniref:Alpha-glucosidase n=1 Tax=Petralouisia muris TaxID=3032872 RepID=A0AC61RXN4_9FIRM|nr:alpha-glucosidase [Petralouisia muris]